MFFGFYEPLGRGGAGNAGWRTVLAVLLTEDFSYSI